MSSTKQHELTDTAAQISLEDLQIIQAALNSGYHLGVVLDLQEQYRKLIVRPQRSKLTQALENALTLVGAYIDEATALAEPEPDDD